MSAGQVLLAAVVLLPLAGLLLRAGRQARRARGPQGQARGGIIAGWLAHRRALRLRQVDHEHGMHRDAWRARLRARETAERERRAEERRSRARGPRGTTVPGDATVSGGATSTTETTDQPWPPSPTEEHTGRRRTAIRPWFIKLRPESPHGGGSGQPPGAPGIPAEPGVLQPGPISSPEPPAQGGDPAPAPPRRPAPGPNGTPPPLEGKIVTTPAVIPEAVPGVEMVIEGLRRIYAHAMAGNIQAKRRAVLALAEIGRRAAMTALTLARAMAEPGQHYGTAVTERLSRMSAMFIGAATAGAEVDAELHAILSTPPGEAMAAGRPMPHHDQFTETGAR